MNILKTVVGETYFSFIQVFIQIFIRVDLNDKKNLILKQHHKISTVFILLVKHVGTFILKAPTCFTNKINTVL
jgi:heme/copper-type cytochrome/quinol oxidase subunit 4